MCASFHVLNRTTQTFFDWSAAIVLGLFLASAATVLDLSFVKLSLWVVALLDG